MRKNLPVTAVEYELRADASIVSRTDLKGRITFVNRDFVESSGFDEGELVGQPHNIVRHPDMPEEAFADLWRTLQRGRPWTGLVQEPPQERRLLLGARERDAGPRGSRRGRLPVGAHQGDTGADRGRQRGVPALRRARCPRRRDPRRTGRAHSRVGRHRIVAAPVARADRGQARARRCAAAVATRRVHGDRVRDVRRSRGRRAARAAGARAPRDAALRAAGPAGASRAVGAAPRRRPRRAGQDRRERGQARRRIRLGRRGPGRPRGARGAAAVEGRRGGVARAQGPLRHAEIGGDFAQHTAVIDRVLDVMERVADASGLVLDPDVDSFYAMDMAVNHLPKLTETLGEARGLGVTIVAMKGQATTADKRALYELVGIGELTNNEVRNAITRLMRGNPDAADRLGPGLRQRGHRRAGVHRDDQRQGAGRRTAADHARRLRRAGHEGRRRRLPALRRGGPDHRRAGGRAHREDHAAPQPHHRRHAAGPRGGGAGRVAGAAPRLADAAPGGRRAHAHRAGQVRQRVGAHGRRRTRPAHAVPQGNADPARLRRGGGRAGGARALRIKNALDKCSTNVMVANGNGASST